MMLLFQLDDRLIFFFFLLMHHVPRLWHVIIRRSYWPYLFTHAYPVLQKLKRLLDISKRVFPFSLYIM
jgi:hypothetical protein